MIEYCCKDMEDAVNDYKFSNDKKELEDLNKYFVYEKDRYKFKGWFCKWFNGCENDDYFGITFCPFCGVKL